MAGLVLVPSGRLHLRALRLPETRHYRLLGDRGRPALVAPIQVSQPDKLSPFYDWLLAPHDQTQQRLREVLDAAHPLDDSVADLRFYALHGVDLQLVLGLHLGHRAPAQCQNQRLDN